MYDRVADDLIRQEGFLFHAAGAAGDGWRRYEVWKTREQLDAWLQDTIFPALPDDAPRPDMDVVDLEVVLHP